MKKDKIETIDGQKENIFFTFEKVDLKSDRQDKKKRRKRFFLSFLVCLLCLGLGGIGGFYLNNAIHPTLNADVKNTFGEIEAILSSIWLYSDQYEDLPKKLEDKAFYGMSQFDDDIYTTYMSDEELSSFTTSINMDYVGIGVQYVMNNGVGIIQRVYVNSPAEKAGLKAGDMFYAVDGTLVDGLSSDEIKALVLGQEDTKVVISIIRDNQKIDFDVIRGEVDNSVYCYPQDDYLVMELESFGVTTGKDIMSYLDCYPDYKRIIIDLRDNTGGYQTSVKEIAGLFIGNDKVYLKQADVYQNMMSDYTKCSKTYDQFEKIVLLVNENTASAAEVFTICLKESLDTVTIVGKTTFGKGVIQSTHMLQNGGALKFTSYYWYSPNGVSINKVGIVPDIEVGLDPVFYEPYLEMNEDETIVYDSVDSRVKISQMCLKFAGYKCDRTDGYFDRSFETSLNEYKRSIDLVSDGILDKVTYESLISHTVSLLSMPENDYQMLKAIEEITQ